MTPDATALFREVADLSEIEREDYFVRHGVSEALRAEVESLLRFDGETDGGLRSRLAAAAESALLATPSAPQHGPDIGPYRLIRVLGRGGMGTVWLAHRTDGSITRPVALKLPRWGHFDRRVLIERFARERDILSALTHPNIARLYDAGVAPSGQPYLALEYVEGQTLTSYVDANDVDVRGRLALFLQILDAVQYAHRSLVIHRDLKPSNIIVSADSVVHLLDFGIAKLMAEERAEAIATELTEQAGTPLTLDFASPEQVSRGALTTASDVYSLGVILYGLLCGQHPYRLERGSRAELEEAILAVEPVAPSRATRDRKLARLLKGDLDTIVLKALRKNPADRYSTADAFARDLRHFLKGEPVEARPGSRLYRLSKFAGRHRAAVSVAATLSGLILASVAFAFVQMNEARAQRDAALFEARRAEASLQLTGYLVGEARIRPGDRTIADRLAKSRELIGKQLEGEPLIRAELLFEMADKLAELRDLATLDEVMTEIGRIAGANDVPWLQARYRCATAELKMNEGETETAAALLRDAFVHLRRERAPQFRALIECLINESFLASLSGDVQRAIDRGQQATRLHHERGLENTNSYAETLSALITAFSFAGDIRGALDATRRQRETYERLGRDDTLSYVTALFFEATFLNRGGRRTEALRRSTEVLEQSRARGLPDNHSQLAYRGIILLGVGQASEALALFETAARVFAKQNMQFDALQMQICAADALLELGDSDAARARLHTHWPAIEAQIEAKNASMTKALRVRARQLAAEGRLLEARAAIDRAKAIVAAAKSPTYTGAAAIFHTAAAVELASGDISTALADIDRAFERAGRDAIDPRASADLGEILLTRAQIHHARGATHEAQRDALAARAHLESTMPLDHRLVKDAARAGGSPGATTPSGRQP